MPRIVDELRSSSPFANARVHKEVLTKEQVELLPLIKKFNKNFGLVGGTAIALYIGHRKSIDFDLFSLSSFNNYSIKRIISRHAKINETIVNKLDEFTIVIKGVRMTFFHYPFKIEFKENLNNVIKMPDLLTLAAMKAYALGMRAKWKDYVDLYFIMKHFHTIDEVAKKGGEIFAGEFNEKMFRAQLAYFKDIDYTERIIYMKGFEIDNKIIKRKLIDFSLN